MRNIDEALEVIKKFEGCKLEAYQDAIGVWTVGYGHTGYDVHEGLKITQEQADQLLRDDLAHVCTTIDDYVTVPLNDNQFSALASFTFNVGVGNFLHSGLLKHLNAGEPKSAMQSLLQWNKAGGKVLEGLTSRREDEKELFERKVT